MSVANFLGQVLGIVNLWKISKPHTLQYLQNVLVLHAYVYTNYMLDQWHFRRRGICCWIDWLWINDWLWKEIWFMHRFNFWSYFVTRLAYIVPLATCEYMCIYLFINHNQPCYLHTKKSFKRYLLGKHLPQDLNMSTKCYNLFHESILHPTAETVKIIYR